MDGRERAIDGAAPDRVPARAARWSRRTGSGVPHRGRVPLDGAAGRRGGASGRRRHAHRAPAASATSTAAVVIEAVAGQVPEYLAELEAEAAVAAGDRAARRCGRRCAATCTRTRTGPTAARRSARWREAARDARPRVRRADRPLAAADRRQRPDAPSGCATPAATIVADAQRASSAPFRILTGIEVDILEDGTLDQEPELLAQLDVVVAIVHSKLRMPSADHDAADGRGDRQPARRRARPLHRADGDARGGGKPARSPSSTRRWSSRPAGSSASRSRSTAGPSGWDPPRRLLELARRGRVPVHDRHRRARAWPAGLAGVRLRARGRVRRRPGPGRRTPGRWTTCSPTATASGDRGGEWRRRRLVEVRMTREARRSTYGGRGDRFHDRDRLAGLQALVLVRAALRPRQHPLRPAAGVQRRRRRARHRVRDAPAPRHGDRDVGARRCPRAPGLAGAHRRHLPRPRAADDRRDAASCTARRTTPGG